MQLRPTHLRRRRVALHLVGVTVLAGSGVLLTGAPGNAADAPRPDSYGGEATASAVHFLADRNPQPTPVTDLIHAELPYATSSMDSSGSVSASAAQVYPGAGLLGVPALLCQAGVPCSSMPPFPDYPLMTTASYPTTPDSQAQTSPGRIEAGPLSTTPNLTVAHARLDRAEAITEAAGLGVADVFTADSATTHSQQAFEGSTLVVTATSTLKGIDLGGGALHIDALQSVAVAHVDGAKVTTSSATTTVSGATAGGTPVTIDSTGVHVATSGDGGAALAGANTALAALDASGVKVRLLTPSRSAKDGTADAVTGGLLVTFDQTLNQANPVPSVPVGPPNGEYLGTLSLGGAGVTAFASPAVDVSVPWVDVPQVPVDVPAGQVGSSGGLTSPTLPGTAAVGVGGIAELAPESATGSTQAGTRLRPVALLGLDLKGARLRALALVLLGYPALVLLTAPLRARPHRRRG